jgi:hypothetical protein
MLMIAPVALGDAQLAASSVVEQLPRATSATSYAAWDGATSYALNAQVCAQFSTGIGLDESINAHRKVAFTSSDSEATELRVGLFTSLYAANTNRQPGSYGWDYTTGVLPGGYYWTQVVSAPSWNAETSYAVGVTVGRINGATGAFYQSLVAGNLGNDPVSAPSKWRQTTSNFYAEYGAGSNYGVDDRVCVTSGFLSAVFTSLQAGNVGHPPTSSPTWWRYDGDSYKEWNAANAYAKDDVIIDLRTHREYEALQAMTAGSGAKDPTSEANAAFWLDRGRTNRWAMLDAKNSTQTLAYETIDTTLTLAELCDSVHLANMRASKVWLSVRRAAASNRNLLLRSEDFSHAAWAKDHSGATLPVVTANYAEAPDGSLSADRIVFNKTGGSFARVAQTVTTASNYHLFELWLRTTTGLGSASVGIGIDGVYANVAVTGMWQRFLIARGSQAANPSAQILLNDSIAGNDESADVLVWGAQVATGSTTLPYQAVEAAYGGQELLYAAPFDMTDNSGITDYRKYFFEPVSYRSDLFVQDLPLYTGALVRAVVKRPGATVAIGNLTVGLARDLGVTLMGAKGGIRDYSRKEPDAFGTYEFVERGFAKTAQFDVAVPNDQYDRTMDLLTERRAKPTLFVGAGRYAAMRILGIPREFSGKIEGSTMTYFPIEVEGLT